MIQKKRLYVLVLLCTIAGFFWVWWNINYNNTHNSDTAINICLFKNITGLPCPSCGSTRSLIHIMKLDFKTALHDNPLGFILAFGLILFPLWIVFDAVSRKSTFFSFYLLTESIIRKRWVTVSFIILITVNWLWNIYKFT